MEGTTWYRLNVYSKKITPVKVVKETDKFVTIIDEFWGNSRERRTAKAGEYFKTFAEARDYRVAALEKSLEYKKEELQRLRSELGQWQAMTEQGAEAKPQGI